MHTIKIRRSRSILFLSSTRRPEHLHPLSSSPVSRTPSSPSLRHKDSTTDRMFQRRFRAAKPTRTPLLSLNTIGRRQWRRCRCGDDVASRRRRREREAGKRERES
ncbi:hypothetical protein Hdeb2414_s0010g00355141 [Helianthus debilis subsp. tardiflorus]